jgi:hypothetical protein
MLQEAQGFIEEHESAITVTTFVPITQRNIFLFGN